MHFTFTLEEFVICWHHPGEKVKARQDLGTNIDQDLLTIILKAWDRIAIQKQCLLAAGMAVREK